jgi:type II secretory pathway pseudopilin PulG
MAPAGASERGITILETMIVLAIIGLMMLIGLPAIRSFVRTDLRADATSVASSLRAAYELATLSGIHHRVVFDVDAGKFQIEACPEPMRLAKADEETLVEASALDEVRAKMAAAAASVASRPALPPPPAPSAMAGGVSGLKGGAPSAEGGLGATPESSMAAAAALAGIQIGGATCTVPTTPNGDADARGNSRSLHGERGVKFTRIHVQHLDKAATEGKAVINFFPLGWSEKAIVEIASGEGDQFSIVVHGLTGRVEIVDGEIDIDAHMRRSATGDEVDER